MSSIHFLKFSIYSGTIGYSIEIAFLRYELIQWIQRMSTQKARNVTADEAINWCVSYWRPLLMIGAKRIVQIDVNFISRRFCAVIGFNLVLSVCISENRKNFPRLHLPRSCRSRQVCTRVGHCQKQGPQTRRIGEDMLGSILKSKE